MPAAEFAKELERDPVYLARAAELEKRRLARVQENLLAAAPVVEDLRRAGYPVVKSPQELVWQFGRTRVPYTRAVPILVDWLPRISNADIKETIVRALSVPWAKEAAPALIQEFRNAPASPPDGSPSPLKWAIGSALEVIADDAIFTDVAELVLDRRHGRDREMLARALAKMRDPRAVDVLIKLLDDDQVAGHAVVALRRLKPKKAEPYLEKLLSRPEAWLRKEAERALKAIRKTEQLAGRTKPGRLPLQ
jgi:PBS lyase HEAT-like repeat-containing protein